MNHRPSMYLDAQSCLERGLLRPYSSRNLSRDGSEGAERPIGDSTSHMAERTDGR
jgi:hypothetical protein